jgi:DNA-binding MarR family transcriptional regulator
VSAGAVTAGSTTAGSSVTHGEHIDRARLADELGAALVQISTVLRRAILPPQISLTQASTLLILRDEGPQRVTSLAEAAQVTQPTMSALVIGMERLGWVRRDASSTDRRAVAVCLTGSGDDVIRELEAARSRALLADLEALTPRDRAALVAALPALRGIIAHEQESKNADKYPGKNPDKNADKYADKAVAW